MRIVTQSTGLQLGQTVLVPALPSTRNWPANGCPIIYHLEPGRIVRGVTIIEAGLRLTLWQVRLLRERSMRVPAEAAGWFEPKEIAA